MEKELCLPCKAGAVQNFDCSAQGQLSSMYSSKSAS